MSPTFEAEVRAPHGKKAIAIPMLVTNDDADEARRIFRDMSPGIPDDTPLEHIRMTQVGRR